ncbi:hypothetical protein EDD15DRAFT_2308736, partial [Pisolithus albus]
TRLYSALPILAISLLFFTRKFSVRIGLHFCGACFIQLFDGAAMTANHPFDAEWTRGFAQIVTSSHPNSEMNVLGNE